MKQFDEQVNALLRQLGESKKMVLSTALHDKVTARTMSIIIANGRFYFQADLTSRKCAQLLFNPNAALCADNIQIEGICTEVGHPSVVPFFCELYERHFATAYKRYTFLKNERVFEIQPLYVQKWMYENDLPFIERYDFINMVYQKEKYEGESSS